MLAICEKKHCARAVQKNSLRTFKYSLIDYSDVFIASFGSLMRNTLVF